MKMSIYTLLILSLATWRIASLLSEEEGPFAIFERFRYWAGVSYDEHSQRYGTNEVARALLCIWCTSVYVGIAWVILYWLIPHVALWLALPFAFSAGAILVESLVDGGG